MPALEIFNPTTTYLQVSSALITRYCRASGTAQVVANNLPQIGNTAPRRITIPKPGGSAAPIMALQVPGYSVAMANSYSGGGVIHFITDAPIGMAVKFYIFEASTSLPASSGTVFETADETGRRTFTSARYPMLGLALISGGSAAYPGLSLATAMLSVGGHRFAGPYDYYRGGQRVPEGDEYDATGYRNDGKLYGPLLSADRQSVQMAEVSYDDVYFGPRPGDIFVAPNWDFPTDVMIIDVSNIPDNTTFF
jgi:hypothetical protein